MARPVIATVRMSRTAQSANVPATDDSGSAPAEDTSPLALPTVTSTTEPRAAVLISALTASHMPWAPNIRFTPVSGLSFFRFGLTDLAETEIPPCAALARRSEAAGQPVAIKIYPDAHHAFDSNAPVRYVPERRNFNKPDGLGATTGGNPAAWADAIQQVTRFFAKYVKGEP